MIAVINKDISNHAHPVTKYGDGYSCVRIKKELNIKPGETVHVIPSSWINIIAGENEETNEADDTGDKGSTKAD